MVKGALSETRRRCGNLDCLCHRAVRDAIRLNRTDAALVKINTPILHGEAEARARAVAFAHSILNELDGYLPR